MSEPIVYTIPTRVAGLKQVQVDGELGWFVLFEGSHEYLGLGEDKPEVEVGDTATIRITFNGRQ